MLASSPVTSLAPSHGPPRIEAFLGRLIELVVYSIEGIRARVQRTSVR